MAEIEYKLKTAAETEIYNHLVECNDSFVPPLSQKVNITVYAKKLYGKAERFEAWAGEKLIGLIAMYYNAESKSSFISNVSVDAGYTNQGIASELLNRCIAYTRKVNGTAIKLEVNKNNSKAIGFYTKFNFYNIEDKGETIILMLSL